VAAAATAKARGRKAIRVARKKHATWRVVTLIIHDGIVLGGSRVFGVARHQVVHVRGWPSLQGLAMADEREHPATHNNTLSPAEFWAGAGVLVCTHAIGLPASMRENPHAKTLVAIRPSIT